VKVRAQLIEGRLYVPVPDLYAAHLQLQPRTLLELRATRDGFFVVPSSADESPSGDERARERAKSRVPTGADVALALGGAPRPTDPPGPVPATSVGIDAETESALRALVGRYEEILRGLPS